MVGGRKQPRFPSAILVWSPPCLWRGSDRVTSDRYKLAICPVFCNADIDSGDKNIITSGLAIDFFNVPTIIITGFRNPNTLITDQEILEGRIFIIMKCIYFLGSQLDKTQILDHQFRQVLPHWKNEM